MARDGHCFLPWGRCRAMGRWAVLSAMHSVDRSLGRALKSRLRPVGGSGCSYLRSHQIHGRRPAWGKRRQEGHGGFLRGLPSSPCHISRRGRPGRRLLAARLLSPGPVGSCEPHQAAVPRLRACCPACFPESPSFPGGGALEGTCVCSSNSPGSFRNLPVIM